MRVLLIENNEDDVRLIQEKLSQTADPVVIECTDRLSKGLEHLRSEDIDVVLLGLDLPDSQGLDTLTQLHTAAPTVPVVVLTGSYADDHLALQAIRIGAQNFFTKSEINARSLRRELQFSIERKKSYDEIRRLSQAVEQSPALTLVTDLQGHIIYVNPKFSEVTGYTPEEVLGQNPRILKSGDTSPERYARMWRTVLSGREWKGIFRNKRKNGESYYASAMIAPMRDANGVITHLLGIEEDITARLEAERVARESKRELAIANQKLLKLSSVKNEFISTVSHDLRTPLAITREGISLMLDEVAGPTTDKQKKVLIAAQSNIDRLARMINDLLDMSKLEAGKVTLKRARVDLAACVKDVLATFAPRAQAQGITLVADVPGQGAWVYADADKLTQVLVNLVDNALKFTEHGHVTVSARAYPDDVICKVEDSGKGIAKENLPKVFSKFEQFDRAAGVGEPGTGLGLGIVKGLIDLHGGVIQVDSKLNQGTTFTFSLPKFSIEAILEEHVRAGIQEAEENSSRMSLLMVSCSSKPRESVIERMQTLIKNMLRQTNDLAICTPDGVAVLLPECDRTGALSVKARIAHALQEWSAHEPPAEQVTLHMGCATYPDDAKRVKDIITRAQQGTTNGIDIKRG